MLRHTHRPQRIRRNLFPVLGNWSNESVVSLAVGSKRTTGFLDGRAQNRGWPVVERVRECGGRMDPLESVLLERQ